MSGKPVVFLDRDGVLNEFVVDPATGLLDSPFRARDVKLIEGAGRAAARLARAGFTLVCVSNQPAAAKRKAPVGRLLEVHSRVAELLALEGAQLATSRLCWHHPEGSIPELTMACACRKPEPGMLLDAAEELQADLTASWMVGDTDTDVAAGRAAGCRTVLLGYGPTAHKRLSCAYPDLRAADLEQGVEMLLESASQRHLPESPFDSLRSR